MTDQPGLSAVVPFRFECRRSARCCSGGAGQVLVEEDELDGLAEALGTGREAFVRLYLRSVHHPERGTVLSIRETFGAGDSGGACALLRDGRECSVYRARPRQCRDFPFWPSILEDAEAFERARATCPGILVEPSAALRTRAFEALSALYDEVDERIGELPVACVQRDECCRFESYGHELYATALEVDYALDRHPELPDPEAPGRCPYHRGGTCTAREGRPLGCRTFFCDPRGEEARQELHEGFLARIRNVEREGGYPGSYGPFPALLRSRAPIAPPTGGTEETEDSR